MLGSAARSLPCQSAPKYEKIGTQMAEKHPFLLSRSAPGGRSVGRLLRPAPSIHQSCKQNSHLVPKYQPNGPQTAEKKHLLHSRGAPWWPIWAPPDGKVAMSLWPTPTIDPSIHQIVPETVEKKQLINSRSAPWWPIWAPLGGKVVMTYPDHPPKNQPNWPTDFVIDRVRMTDRHTHTLYPWF